MVEVTSPKDYILPTWEAFFSIHILWPAVVQVSLGPLFALLSVVYAHYYDHKGKFHGFVRNFIGTTEKPRVNYPIFILFLETIELVCSCVSVGQFVVRTYMREKIEPFFEGDMIVTSFFTFHYFFRRMQMRFNPWSAWQPDAIIDALTIVPIFVPPIKYDLSAVPHGMLWLNLNFLRSHRALCAWERLVTVIPQQGSEFFHVYKQLVLFALNTLSMVICMGGTIYVLEVLGEIPGLEEDPIDTQMGALSFVQMSYWIVTTISTVGYGDYAPKTIPSRLCIMAFIFTGVIFFGNQASKLVDIAKLVDSGLGSYAPRSLDDMHIVVVGSGLSCEETSPVLLDFLHSLMLTQTRGQVVNMVLMSESPMAPHLKCKMRESLPPRLRQNVWFLVGSAMNAMDLERAKLRWCHMAFVLPNTEAIDGHEEDGQNIFRVMHMKAIAPGLRFRLLLLEPESQRRALDLGISKDRCFAIREMKAVLLANAVRVKGLVALINGLLTPATDFDIELARKRVRPEDWSWMSQYLMGLKCLMYAFIINDSLVGCHFSDAAVRVYEQSSGSVLLVAAQSKGRLVLNFNGTLKNGQVVFAISRSSNAYHKFAIMSEDWRVGFLKSRHDPYAHTKRIRTSAVYTGVELLQQYRDHCKFSYDLKEIQKFSAFAKSHASAETSVLETASVGVQTVLSGETSLDGIQDAILDPTFDDFMNASSSTRLGRVKSDDPTYTAKAMDGKDAIAPSAPKKDLVVLLVVGDADDSVWCQVVAFLRTLRSSFLPAFQPIVVFSSTEPPIEIARSFEPKDVIFFVGPVMRIQSLMQASVHEAQTIVVLRGVSSRRDVDSLPGCSSSSLLTLRDHQAVALVGLVEHVLAASYEEHFTMFELGTIEAVHLAEVAAEQVCQSLRKGYATGSRTLVVPTSMPLEIDCGLEPSSDTDLSVVPSVDATMPKSPVLASFSYKFKSTSSVDKFHIRKWIHDKCVILSNAAFTNFFPAEAVEHNKLLFDRRFASGQAITPDFFGSLLGYMFHFPAVIELVEALVMPVQRGQEHYVWQVACPPEWIGKNFGDMLCCWCRREDPQLKLVGSVLILALYRRNPNRSSVRMTRLAKFEASTGSDGYSLPLPDWSVKLLEGDLVTVIGSREFGCVMEKRHLLRGACNE